MSISITKRMGFCYGHYLPEYNGKCAVQHGHNAVVEVTVQRTDKKVSDGFASDNTYPGMVMDFGALKPIMEQVINEFDHKNLNDVTNPDGTMLLDPPTAENMVSYIAYAVRRLLPTTLRVIKCRVSETPDSWATWEV